MCILASIGHTLVLAATHPWTSCEGTQRQIKPQGHSIVFVQKIRTKQTATAKQRPFPKMGSTKENTTFNRQWAKDLVLINLPIASYGTHGPIRGYWCSEQTSCDFAHGGVGLRR